MAANRHDRVNTAIKHCNRTLSTLYNFNWPEIDR